MKRKTFQNKIKGAQFLHFYYLDSNYLETLNFLLLLPIDTMANADCNTLNGIYGNEQIMDHLYRYGDMLERKGKMSASINYDFEACAMHRISSINICLLEIESKKPGVNDESDTYFNYLRWNRKAINGEFDNFLQHPCMEKHREILNASYQLFDNCMKEFYGFTHADMSIINEHTHICDMISSRRRQPRKALLLQAGRLFANFINILKSRYYDEDTTDIQFADIEMQAGVIIEKLSTEHPQEANKVKGVYEDFNNWTKRQDSLRMVHIESLEKAMNLAHARATKAKVQKRHAVFRPATNNWNLFEALFTCEG